MVDGINWNHHINTSRNGHSSNSHCLVAVTLSPILIQYGILNKASVERIYLGTGVYSLIDSWMTISRYLSF